MVFCRCCGTKLLADAKFCTKCGAAVGQNQIKQEQTKTCTVLGRVMAIIAVVLAVVSATISWGFIMIISGFMSVQPSMPVVATILSVQPIAALVMAGIGKKQGCTGKMVMIATILSILAVIAYGISIPVMFARL